MARKIAPLLPTSSPAEEPEWARSRAEKFEHLRSALLLDPRQLTLREAEICAYIVLGYKVLGISLILGISINTVSFHLKNIYTKLQVHSKTEAVAKALREHLV